MLGTLLQNGYEPTESTAHADYLVVNTCGFLEAARKEAKDSIEQMLSTKKASSKLIVTGCMVNLHKDQILKDYPQVDAVLGAGSIDKILTVVKELDDTVDTNIDRSDNDGDGNETDTDRLSSSSKDAARSFLNQADVPRVLATPSHYAYLKIAEGCKKRCSFCIIPKIKGPLQSKAPEQVVRECKALVESGVSEIVLIAQDLGDYGKDFGKKKKKTTSTTTTTTTNKRMDVDVAGDNSATNGTDTTETTKEATLAAPSMPSLPPPPPLNRGDDLASLLRSILTSLPKEEYPTFQWLRLMYLYPDEITDDILEVMEGDDRICRYVDMPIQHVSDRILGKMRRKTTGDGIRQTISTVRDRLPGMHIRTSLMVGFPGETEDEFEELLSFVREARLENVGVFQYSNEELADSSRIPDQIPEETKEARYRRLMEAQLEVVRLNNESMMGKELHVVLEDERDDYFIGRYYGQCADIDGQVLIEKTTKMPKATRRPFVHRQRQRRGPQGSMIGLPPTTLQIGQRYPVRVTGYDEYDLIGRLSIQ